MNRVLSNQDLIRKAEIAEDFADWVEALVYYHELILNTDNQDLIRACIDAIGAINLIIDSIAIRDKIRSEATNHECL